MFIHKIGGFFDCRNQVVFVFAEVVLSVDEVS